MTSPTLKIIDEKYQHQRQALAALPLPVLILSADGQVIEANRRFREHFPFASGQKNEFCDTVGWQKLLELLHQRGFLEEYPLGVTDADGRVASVLLSAYPLDVDGEKAFIILMMDATHEKKIQTDFTRQIERLNALYSVNQAVVSGLDLDGILKMLAQKAAELLDVDAVSVLLFDSETQTLEFAVRQGFHTDAIKFTRLKVGSGLAGRAAQERSIVHISNLAELNGNSALVKALIGEQFVAYYGIPLISQGELLGVMEIFHRAELTVSPDWLIFLQTLAGQAAIALRNAHMFQTARQNLDEINALYKINQDLIASTDPGTLMKNVVDLLQANFGYYYVQVFVRDAKTGDFVMREGSGEIGQKIKNLGYRLAPGAGLVGFTAETGKPFLTNDVEQVISFERPPFLIGTQSELAVPIRAAGQFLGLLDVHQTPPLLLTERDVRLVFTVADQLAIALQKANLYTELQESLRQEQETRAQLIHNEKLTVAGRLLASVSHELNNPIQAIQNALFLLKSENLSAQGRQDLEIVLAETDRMAAMLQRLRRSYLPAGRGEFSPVALNDLVDEVSMLVATHLRHSQISFEFHPDPDLPLVLGSEDQLRQVILNLVINAVDAMSSGGHLTISTQADEPRGEILVTIADSGPGIAPEVLPKIFEAFVTTKEHGSGLGLNICSQIVQAHQGRISAENNPQGGATFFVWLPAAGAEAE